LAETHTELTKKFLESSEQQNWLKKIHGENNADKNLEGLPVYTDSKSGKSFVTMGDLRQLVNEKLPAENRPQKKISELMSEALRKKAVSAMSDYNSVPVKQQHKIVGKSGTRGQSN
jgi:hypothetical protein